MTGTYTHDQAAKERDPMRDSSGNHPLNRLWPAALVLLFVLGLLALWRFTPLREQATQQTVSSYIEKIRHFWWTPLALAAAYVVVHGFLFPNTVLNAAVILSIGGFRGWLYAIVASLTSATLYYFVGRRYGAIGIHAIEGRRLDLVKRSLRKGGFGAVALVRLAPVAPYTVVNTLAGGIELKYRDFAIGTFLAHLPGTLTLAVLGEQMTAAIAEPSIVNIAVAAALVVVGVVAFAFIRRYAHRHLTRDSKTDGNGNRGS